MSAVRITSSNYAGLVMASEKPGPVGLLGLMVRSLPHGIPCGGRDRLGQDDLLVGKVNVDEEPELASAFNISSIPTLVVLKDGKVVNLGDRRETQIEHSVPGQITNFVLLSPSNPNLRCRRRWRARKRRHLYRAAGHIQKWASSLQKVPAQPRTARLTTPAMYYIILYCRQHQDPRGDTT